jgi:putative peptide zinc metalloprotease protein
VTMPPIAPKPALLRPDLTFMVRDDTETSRPATVVTDPVRGSFFALQWPESAVLLTWRSQRSSVRLQEGTRRMFGVDVRMATVEAVLRFAERNQLIVANGAETSHSMHAQWQQRTQSIALRILHNYLFFRVPVLRPDTLLRQLVPICAVFFSSLFWRCVAIAAMVGVYLASRQPDAVTAAFAASFSIQALPSFAIALLGLKIVHEFGHAIAASRLGCRVPTMGVAVMLGAPVFYTDVSDSWRLPRHADRLTVVAAGVAAEAIVATVALVAWSLMPDGTVRQLCFALATTAVVLSLTINLNPFMRYDGYFALSDWWRVPNLQARAFDLGLWRLREILFGLGHPPPETLAAGLQRKLIIYAWMTAIYRLFLFLGIAVIVFFMAGKAVGLVLAAIEISVFIGRPILAELKEWWVMRYDIAVSRRGRITAIVAASVCVLSVCPLLTTAEAPAILAAVREEPLHLPTPAQLTKVAVRDGQTVRAGEVLFEATSPALVREFEKAIAALALVRVQVDRSHVHERERDLRLVHQHRLAAALEKVAGIERRIGQLVIRAPFDGTVVDLDPVAAPARWFGVAQPLARLIDNTIVQARGVLADDDLMRVKPGARATFVPDDPARARSTLRVTDLRSASDGRLSEISLSERHGGSVPTGGPKGDQLVRRGAFEVVLIGDQQGPPHLVRGVLRIDADAVSPARVLWRSVARVLVREQGF